MFVDVAVGVSFSFDMIFRPQVRRCGIVDSAGLFSASCGWRSSLDSAPPELRMAKCGDG